MRFIDTLLAFILIGSASCYLTQLLSQADISIDSTGRYQGIVVYVGHREGPSDSSTYLITAQVSQQYQQVLAHLIVCDDSTNLYLTELTDCCVQEFI